MSHKHHHAKLILSPIPLNLIIGILPHERITPQPVTLHLELTLEIQKASTTDAIQDTVNYAELLEKIKSKSGGTQYNLIETLAENIAGWVLEDNRIQKVKVQLDKPHVFNGAPNISIVIKRGRS
jgi:FolB domain-containing protein